MSFYFRQPTLALLCASFACIPFTITAAAQPVPRTVAYDFSFTTLTDGKPLPLSQFAGKVLLIVNTASHCGFTSQYAGLEALYQEYQAAGLVVIGVPSNDFGQQEPGNHEEIANFCKLNFGVTFPMTAKETLSGEKAHPFYIWAKQKMGFVGSPKWNFHKYLVDRKGDLVDYFYSTTTPDSKKMKQAIEKALAAPIPEPE